MIARYVRTLTLVRVLQISISLSSLETLSKSAWYSGLRMSWKLATLRHRLSLRRFLRASVTVRGASPTLSAISCGYIGPSCANLSSTSIELLVRPNGSRILLSSLVVNLLPAKSSPAGCRFALFQTDTGNPRFIRVANDVRFCTQKPTVK
jgi:hypothetical protein